MLAAVDALKGLQVARRDTVANSFFQPLSVIGYREAT